jgi:predicted ATP-binding protein involved in virulence
VCRYKLIARPGHLFAVCTMDGLSAAAAVATIIEISAKIASLCLEYSLAVKNAKKDIHRLKTTVDNHLAVMRDFKLLIEIEEHDTTRFQTTENL